MIHRHVLFDSPNITVTVDEWHVLFVLQTRRAFRIASKLEKLSAQPR